MMKGGWFAAIYNLGMLITSADSIFHSVNSIRTPMLIQGRLERTETNLMQFKWEVTWTYGNQPNAF